MMLIFLGVMSSVTVQAQSKDLVGPVTKEQILDSERIYEIYMKRYTPDSAAVEYMATLDESLEVIVFLGSWCPESKKYIPRLMKALEVSSSEHINVKYVGVDAQKKSPKEFLKKHQIKYIPSVVVLKGDIEVGRLAKKPQEPIELEFVEILKRVKKIE